MQYAIVCYIAQLMLRKDLEELNNLTTRGRIGNLYLNLDTRKRSRVMFGLMFFVQRCLVVLLLAIESSFALQWQLCQAVLILNTAYILTVRPYSDASA